MSEEFEIYNNLNLISGHNLLSQLCVSVAANCSNGGENVDDSFDDLESILNNNTVTGNKTTIKKAKAKKSEIRTTSSEKETPLSQSLKLLENADEVLSDTPADKGTKRILGINKTPVQRVDDVETLQMATSSKRGRSGRGRGRGRKSVKTKVTSTADDSSNLPTDLERISDTPESIQPAADSSIRSSSRHLAVMRNRRRYFAEKAANCPTLDTIDLVSSPFPFSGVYSSAQSSSTENRATTCVETVAEDSRPKNRRRYLAEKAAYCVTLDSIDLVNSPFPRVEGSITLDSEGEEERPELVKEPIKDTFLEDDNPELSVKIIWNCKPEALKLRKYQKFSTLFKLFAEREGVELERIAFNLNERIISPDDTPDSIGYKIFHFINGRVMTTNVSSNLDTFGEPKKQRIPNQISLKIQSGNWKKPIHINIMKSDKFRILYIKCAEEINVDVQQIKLSFDGEHLDPNETPENLDIEDGEAIDLHLKN